MTRAYCPGSADGCPPLTIYGTPRVPEHEPAKIVRALARCEHGGGGPGVNVYWFEVVIAGLVTEDHAEALGAVLAGAGGLDATVQAGERGGAVMFSRQADDAVQAVVSAIADVEAAGMTVTGVTEDLVVAAEIAQRAKVTGAAVRYWMTGDRGPGRFPEPVVARERASLYSWAQVSAWLSAARLGEVDHLAAETARACALINAALTVRRGLRELPQHDRPLITRLVA